MKYLSLVFTAGLCGVLVGCGKGSPNEAAPAANSNPGSLLNSPKVMAKPSTAEASTTQGPRFDASVPLERYTDLNALPAGAALSFLVTAKDPTPLANEERLDRLSSKYHSESDVFKKQEIAKVEAPTVDAQLSTYRSQAYYTLPISGYADQALSLTNLSVGPYEPATRSFPLVGYGGGCWASVIRNRQGAALRLDGSGPACAIVVQDETTARAIEASRAARTLQIQGTAYVFVSSAANGVANGTVTAAKVELKGGSPLAPFGSFLIKAS